MEEANFCEWSLKLLLPCNDDAELGNNFESGKAAHLPCDMIEFNELFGLSAFQQLDVTNAVNCYNMLLLEKPDNIIYNFNYGALLANIGNHSKSVHYLSIAANRKFFPAALALAKSTIGSFNFTMNKYYLNSPSPKLF